MSNLTNDSLNIKTLTSSSTNSSNENRNDNINNNNNNNQLMNNVVNSNVNSSQSDKQLRHHIEQRHLELYRQNSIKKPRVVRNDLESKINRVYSKLLVDYHWVFLVTGVLISIVLTSVSFVKQPLPNFLDPKRGFGARGEGTLTSQLIVMKNVNVEIMKYNKYILDLYEEIKKKNNTDDFDEEAFAREHSNSGDSSEAHSNGHSNGTNTDFEGEEDDEEDENEDSKIDEIEYKNDDYKPVRDNNNNNNNTYNNNNDDDYDMFDHSNSTSKRRKIRETYASSNLNLAMPIDSIKNDLLNSEVNVNKLEFESLMKQIIHRKLTTAEILKMMPSNSTINKDSKYFSNHVFNQLEQCNYTLGSDTNIELYFSASKNSNNLFENLFSELVEKYNRTLNTTASNSEYIDMDSEYSLQNDPYFDATASFSDQISYLKEKEENLLNIAKLKSLCKWDKKMLQLLLKPNNEQTVCYFSLPQSIAVLNNKTDCMDLSPNDVRNFINLINKCHNLYEKGVLFAAAEEYKQKSEIFKLLDKRKPISSFVKLPTVRDNICFKKNMMYIIFDYLIDKDFLVNKTNLNIKISSLLILNSQNDSKIVPSQSSKKNSYKQRNENKLFNENYMYNIYLKYFHKERYDDQTTTLAGINLMGIRQEAAMKFISQEMLLVALAITLIVIVTLLYLKSIFISLIVNFGVAMSVGVSFFAYRIVFDIDLFPFINMMAAFLLIGIACDNVYVLFDSWYNEKGKIILEDLPDMIDKQYGANQIDSNSDDNKSVSEREDSSLILPPIFIKRRFYTNKEKRQKQTKRSSNPIENESFLNLGELNQNNSNIIKKNTELSSELIEKGIDINDYELNPAYVRLAPLTDEQMVRVMGGTLRHAAMSIFVTSFTTAAAFLTNFITKLPYVQLFGVFTGTCILVYFSMVITMVAAFVISYEKFIQPFSCKVSTRLTRSIENKFQKMMDYLGLLNYRLISQILPKVLIKFRVVFFIVFFLLGLAGMLAVFYKPQLKPPANWRYQFFKTGNLFESFEFQIKDHFWSYVNEEKRNMTNPEIYFIFGIIDKDNGRIFNPDDDGHLIYDNKFDFLSKGSQVWLHKFISESIASRRDLFLVDDITREWRNYLMSMQQFCYNTLKIEGNFDSNIYLPYDPHGLAKCRDEINDMLVNSTLQNFENLMASFPRQIVFMANGKDVNAILLRIKANRTFYNHDAVRDYYLELKDFHQEVILDKAPDGFNTGWFISVAFALYDLQYQLITGTYASLVASMAIALIILLLTSGNIIISLFAILTISFSIADTIAIFVFLGWDLSILESVIIIMSVGLSVDFSCHYGVAYINCDTDFSSLHSSAVTTTNNEIPDNNSTKLKTKKKCSFIRKFIKSYKHNNKERFTRIHDIFERVGSAVLMAALTTFLAGFSMFPSGLVSFGKMGQFLMLVMCFSYLYATFFFVPMCALFGPTKNFGKLKLKELFSALWNACTFCFRNDKKNKKPSSSNNNNNNNTSSTNKKLIYTNNNNNNSNNSNNDDSNNKLLVNANNNNEAQL